MQLQVDEVAGHAIDVLRVAAQQEIDAVLGLDDVLADDLLLALVPADLGQETLDGQLGAAGPLLRVLGHLQALLHDLDRLVEDPDALVERHELIVVVGDVRDELGDEGVPGLGGGVVAQDGRVPRVVELPPDVRRPQEQGGQEEVGDRVGEEPAGGERIVEDRDAGDRVQAGLLDPDPAGRADGRQVRPLARDDLVAGDLDVLGEDPQLLVPFDRTSDQGDERRVVEELFDPEPRGVVRAVRGLEDRRQVGLRVDLAEVVGGEGARPRLGPAEGGDPARRQDQ